MQTFIARFPERALLQVLVCAAAVLASTGIQARATDTRTPVTISALHGDVRVTSSGTPVKAAVGMAVKLPAAIHTGADGSIELRQGETIVSAAPNAQLDIPVSADPAETLDRIIQSSGNVYYSIAKRTSSKLRVETRYLVAVIKGTQFNVSVTAATSTLSLLEGLVELRSADGSDVTDIAAGQVGTISADQPRIRVLSLTSGEAIRGGAAPAASANGRGAGASMASGNSIGGSSGATGSAAVIGAGVSTAAISSQGGGVMVSNLASGGASAAAGAGGADTVGALQSLAARTSGSSAASGSPGSGNANAGNAGNANPGNAGNAGNANPGNAGNAGNANPGSGGSTTVVEALQNLSNKGKGSGKGP